MKNTLPPGYTYRPLPDSVTTQLSDIEGLGLFATTKISKDIILGVSHILCGEELIRTPLGGFINSSDTPNAEIIPHELIKDRYVLKMLRDVDKEEITVDYNKSVCGLTDKLYSTNPTACGGGA